MKERFIRNERGGFVLEAALTLPFFLAFLIALICMIRIAMAETALKSAVAEASKFVAAHMYPVQLLADHALNTGSDVPGKSAGDWIRYVYEAKERARQSSQFLDEYAAFIPDSLLPLAEWMEKLQDGSPYTDSAVNAAFLPLVQYFADQRILNVQALNINKVTLPSITDKDRAFFGIEAVYTMTLHIPFYRKEIVITQNAFERVWIGR